MKPHKQTTQRVEPSQPGHQHLTIPAEHQVTSTYYALVEELERPDGSTYRVVKCKLTAADVQAILARGAHQ